MEEHERALVGTRPWVVAGSTTAEGAWLRYTARDDHVFAFIAGADGADGATSVTLGDVTASRSTTVEALDGTPLRWHDTPDGITVHLDAPTTPTVVVLGHVGNRVPTSGP